jgi:hypothetical protein
MPHEIDYIYYSWNGQYEEALNIAIKVLESLEGGQELKPYRSFWYHQTAISAFLAWKNCKNDSFRLTAISYLDKASGSSSDIRWLNKLRCQLAYQENLQVTDILPLQDWFMEINNLLEKWGIKGSNYSRQVASVQDNIENTTAECFENGLASLGKMLGARTHQWLEEEGAPDGLWIFGDWHAFVFEAKTDENQDKGISLKTVRQTATHEERVRADNLIPHFVPCSTILISPRNQLHSLAVPHTKDISYLSHDDVIQLFKNTASALEQVRTCASGNTEEALKENAIRIYTEKSITMQNIKDLLLKVKLSDLLII